MSKGIMAGVIGVIAVLIIIIGISLGVGYNRLITKDEDINSKYAQIEVRLQERHDKIGQLIATVDGLQEHAETIYNAITEARQAYADAIADGDMDALIEADAQEALALTDVLLVVEDNPLITASGGYYTLMDEISSMESALAVARRDYNNAVQEYNTSVRKFPTVLYAGIFGFEQDLDYWKMNDGADEVPEIDFGN
jgi:LemA protein